MTTFPLTKLTLLPPAVEIPLEVRQPPPLPEAAALEPEPAPPVAPVVAPAPTAGAFGVGPAVPVLVTMSEVDDETVSDGCSAMQCDPLGVALPTAMSGGSRRDWIQEGNDETT